MADPEVIPLSERNRPTDEDEEEEEEGRGTNETSFTENRNRERNKDGNDSIDVTEGTNRTTFDWNNLRFPKTRDELETELLDADDIERRKIAAEDVLYGYRILKDLRIREGILEKVYGKRFRGVHGPNSKKLFRSLETERSDKDGSVTGLMFRDSEKPTGSSVKVIVGVKFGKERETGSDTIEIRKFKELVEKAKKEFGGRADIVAYDVIRATDPELPITQEILDEVRSNSEEVLEDRISDEEYELQNAVKESESFIDEAYKRLITDKLTLSEKEKRDSESIIKGGIFRQNITAEEGIEFLDVDVEYWEKKSEEEQNPMRKKFFQSVSDTAKLQREYIRLKNNIKPEEEETLEILEDEAEKSNMRTFEKFKKWAKENMLGLSAVAISVAGIITTVVMGAKKAAKIGGKALKGFAKSVANFLGKLGPLFSGLATLAAALIKFTGNGLLWLADHLWVLAVAITYALYEWWKNRKNRKK